MADAGNAPKPSSSVKLVLLGEAAVGKVGDAPLALDSVADLTPHSLLSSSDSSTTIFKRTRSQLSVVSKARLALVLWLTRHSGILDPKMQPAYPDDQV